MTEVSPNGRSEAREPTHWGFAEPGPLREKLTSLALGGGKVVTTGLLAEYEILGEPVEQPGDHSILVDSADAPVAVIEDVLSRVIRLADMTDQDAIDEGEGYADAAAFRVSHEEHWNESIEWVREGLGDPTFTITDDTLVVAERFRIVSLLDPAGHPMDPNVRPAYPPDRAAVDAFLAEHDADLVARRGELVDARQHPALLAEVDGELAGVLTWILSGTTLEVLTLHAVRQWAGAGTALLAAARRVAEASGARRLWLITTNDNVDALRFYQRRGWRLARVDAGAVDRSRRTIKPAIPEVGAHGIPLRDELELELWLDGAASDPPPALADELLALELALARRDEASIPGGYDAVLHADFAEIGASGRFWARAETLELLAASPPDDTLDITRFDVSPLGDGLVLVTYDVVRGGDSGSGRRFNQGTPADP
jgi:uncharacterized protein YhfF/N-acetylglutamate synthase-like GNAT family acetyltransferase